MGPGSPGSRVNTRSSLVLESGKMKTLEDSVPVMLKARKKESLN